MNKDFLKNMFLVECDSMKPYLKRGDIAIYEPIKPNCRFASSVYLIQIKKRVVIRRVQFLIKGGINIISDSKQISKHIKQEDLQSIIFLGHIIGRIKRETGKLIKDYSLFSS